MVTPFWIKKKESLFPVASDTYETRHKKRLYKSPKTRRPVVNTAGLTMHTPDARKASLPATLILMALK